MDVRSTDSDEGLTTQGAFGHHIHATGERDFLVAQELLRSSRRGILSFHEESERTTLYDFISAQRAANVPYNPRRYFSYARQITRAVGFLHKEKIYSVTPCPHTIFLDNENSSIILAENDKIPVSELAEWKSPEELVFGQKFPIKSDIFSLGTTFHHLWTYGQHPFGGNSHQRVATIQRGDDPEFGQMFIENEEIAQSMSRIMLTHDPTLRPTTMDVLYELMTLSNGSPESIARLGDTLARIERETQTISKERDPDKLERARQKLESVTKQGLYQGHFGTSVVPLSRRPAIPPENLISVKHSLYTWILERIIFQIPFNAKLHLSFSKQIANGLNFLNKNGVDNCSLNPIAIFINVTESKLYISDYAYPKESKELEYPEQDRDVWKTPEEFNTRGRFPFKSDIFSLGVIFHILWSNGKHPFGEDTSNWCNALKNEDRPSFANILIPHKEFAINLMKWMLQIDPAKRPTIKEVLRQLNLLIKGPDEILAQLTGQTPTQTNNAKQLEMLTDVLKFGKEIKQHIHDHLSVIDLSGVAVTLEDIKAIANIIDYAFELEKIDLSFCHLKAGSISHLKNAITTKPKVHNLLVHGNPHLALEDLVDGVKFVAEGKVEAQFQYDEAYLPDEEKWKLKDFAGVFQETDGARRRGAVEVTRHSKTIDFNQQKVSNEVIRSIASTMNFSTRLDEINLTSCHLRPGAICLLNALVISNSKVGRIRVMKNFELTADDLMAGTKLCSRLNAVFEYDYAHLSPEEGQRWKTYLEDMGGRRPPPAAPQHSRRTLQETPHKALKLKKNALKMMLEQVTKARQEATEVLQMTEDTSEPQDIPMIDRFKGQPLSLDTIQTIASIVNSYTELGPIDLTNCSLEPGAICLLNKRVTSANVKVKRICIAENDKLTGDDLIAGIKLCARVGAQLEFDDGNLKEGDYGKYKKFREKLGIAIPDPKAERQQQKGQKTLEGKETSGKQLFDIGAQILNLPDNAEELIAQMEESQKEEEVVEDLAETEEEEEADISSLLPTGDPSELRGGVQSLTSVFGPQSPGTRTTSSTTLGEEVLSTPTLPQAGVLHQYSNIPTAGIQHHANAPTGIQHHASAPAGIQHHANAPTGIHHHASAPAGIHHHASAPAGIHHHANAPAGIHHHASAPAGIHHHANAPTGSLPELVTPRGQVLSPSRDTPIEPRTRRRSDTPVEPRTRRHRVCRRKKDRLVVFDSTNGLISKEGGKMEVGGCFIAFPSGSFDDVSNVYAKSEIDSSKWPSKYICITSMLWVESQRKLLARASVSMKSWCMKDCANDSREIFVDVLHQRKGSSVWDVVDRLPLNDRKIFHFECTDFSPYVLGIRKDEISATDLVIEGLVYAGKGNNFTLAFFLQHELILKSVTDTMKQKGSELELNFNPLPVKTDDKISAYVNPESSEEEGQGNAFRFPTEFKESFQIDTDFVRLIKKTFFHSPLTGTGREMQRVLLKCGVEKNEVHVGKPQYLNYTWKPTVETGANQVAGPFGTVFGIVFQNVQGGVNVHPSIAAVLVVVIAVAVFALIAYTKH